jgi:hypothetical protein
MPLLIPIQFLAIEAQTVNGLDTHVAYEVPQFLYGIVICGICLYVCLWVELLVKLLHEDAPWKYPPWRVDHLIDHPSLSNHAISHDPRVADESVDAISTHHRYGVALIDGGGGMLLWLRTRDGHKQGQQQ